LRLSRCGVPPLEDFASFPKLLQKRVIRFAAQQFESLLVPVIVRVNVHKPFQRLARLRHVPLLQVNVEQLDQHFKILPPRDSSRYKAPPRIPESLAISDAFPDVVRFRGKLVLLLVRVHAPLSVCNKSTDFASCPAVAYAFANSNSRTSPRFSPAAISPALRVRDPAFPNASARR